MAALPEPDQAVMREPAVRRAFVRMVRESMRQGPRGPQLDTALMACPWDFEPAQIRMPVRLWQGERDRNAPPVMARHLAAAIPRSDAAFFPDEGHISVMAHHLGEVLAALA